MATVDSVVEDAWRPRDFLISPDLENVRPLIVIVLLRSRQCRLEISPELIVLEQSQEDDDARQWLCKLGAIVSIVEMAL